MKKMILFFTIFLIPMLPDINLRGQVCVGMLISGFAPDRNIRGHAYYNVGQGFSLANAEERSVTVKPKEKRDLSVEAKKGLDTALLNAKYHALIIGNNNYKYITKLKTAAADAKAVDKLLSEQYGFKTKLLIDATRKDILSAMNDFRALPETPLIFLFLVKVIVIIIYDIILLTLKQKLGELSYGYTKRQEDQGFF